jgi:acetolactate synthase I/II/III large subunit
MEHHMMPSDNATVAERIALALKRHGVDTIFAQSLPSAVILAAEAIGIRQVAYRQENMGGAMADGYARLSGRIGVVAAQNGPAATLLVPPLAEAYKASIPVLALVQDVERPQLDRNAFQELDHFALFSSCAKSVRRILTADRVDDYVDGAFVAAGTGRPGPAVLLLPADLLRERAAPARAHRTLSCGTWPIDRTRPASEAIERAAEMIVSARSPVVIAGGGVISSAATAALSRLQQEAHIPVFTTNMGKGSVDEFHPLSCGVLGALTGRGSLGRRTRILLEEADVVLLVGTRTNQNGTDSWRSIPPEAHLIHIDIDPQEIGRNYQALRLTGDAATTLNALCEILEKHDLSRRRSGRVELERRIAVAWRAFDTERDALLVSSDRPIRPERLMRDLQELLTAETTVVADASYSSMWVVGQLRGLRGGMRFITPRGLAGLGWGLPLAIGAKLAEPQHTVIAIVGDGGFAHSWAEIETMVRSRVAVVVIVLNNGVLGYQKDAETAKFGRFTTACQLGPVSHAEIARACGCNAIRIEAPRDLAPAIKAAISSGRPWLIDLVTCPEAHPPLSLYDGTLDKSEVSETSTQN